MIHIILERLASKTNKKKVKPKKKGGKK